ncbi:MAG: acyltransferase [Xanthomonadaceae bacterium]|jgi:1-acyl-sn-glycerol-3-phosphate acyltransferase|nr:acyltransferase [Xanthomonadaceae bacterium]
MLTALPAFLRLPLAALSVVLNTLVHATPLLALALVKALLPLAAARRWLSRMLVALAESWVSTNSRLLALFTPTRWRIEGMDGLSHDGWYLVLANHQTWVDIPVLQHALNRRVPFLKFFLKQPLIWVPVLGLAWWALDFPFMRRYSRELLERRPELRGRDLEATRRACAKFRQMPVSVTNFVEGTRLTPRKHADQGSPYRHLLKPRAGGVAFVLGAMGDTLRSLVDVTIAYPGGRPTMLDLLAGRVAEIVVHVRERPIPSEFTSGDYENDPAFRERMQAWLNGIWAEKDAVLAAVLEGAPAASPVAKGPGHRAQGPEQQG